MTVKNPNRGGLTYVVGSDTLNLNMEHCSCKIQIYKAGQLIEKIFDPLENDSTHTEINQFEYNQKGQVTSKATKSFNLPWATMNYDYDTKGRLKKEFSNSNIDRWGEYSIEYIYDKGV